MICSLIIGYFINNIQHINNNLIATMQANEPNLFNLHITVPLQDILPQHYFADRNHIFLHPARDGTHILAYEMFPTYYVVHFSSKAKILRTLEIPYHCYTDIAMITEQDVIIMTGQNDQRGKIQYQFTVWNLKTYQSNKFQHFCYKKTENHAGTELFVFYQTKLFCVCQTSFEEMKKNPLIPSVITLTFYKFEQNGKFNTDPLHIFRYELRNSQSELMPKPVKANQNSMIAFLNQNPVDKNLISFNIYEFNIQMRKGKMTKFEFQHGLQSQLALSDIVIAELWQLKPQNFYLKLQASFSKYKYICEECPNIQDKLDQIHKQYQYFWNSRSDSDRAPLYKPVEKYYQVQFIDCPRQIKNFSRKVLKKTPKDLKAKQYTKQQIQIIEFPIYFITDFKGKQMICGKIQTAGTIEDESRFYPIFFGKTMALYQLDRKQLKIITENIEFFRFEQPVVIAFLAVAMIENCDDDLVQMIVEMIMAAQDNP